MKSKSSWILWVLMGLGLIFLAPETGLANSAEPPGFVILVSNPPKDLQMWIVAPDKPEDPVELEKEIRGWETLFRYYYHQSEFGPVELNDARLRVQTGEETFAIDLPQEVDQTYNNLLTMNIEARSLVSGQPPWRVPLLVFLRVLLTLLVEGVIFWIFGYRLKTSWGLFIVVNLLTQLGLNLMLTGPALSPYWFFAFILLEAAILLLELALYVLLLKEHGKLRAALIALTANGASLVIGGWLISRLPV